jgi:hypothetical protein
MNKITRTALRSGNPTKVLNAYQFSSGWFSSLLNVAERFPLENKINPKRKSLFYRNLGSKRIKNKKNTRHSKPVVTVSSYYTMPLLTY